MKLFTLLIVLNLTALFATAQPGSLDLTFNDSGKVFVPGFGIVRASAVQEDGKILIAGEFSTTEKTGFIIARYLPDGIIDPSFGTNGYVHTLFDGGTSCYSLSVLKSGKILASGYGLTKIEYPYYQSPIVIQYLPDGSLDASFGDGGKVATNTGELFGGPVYARAMQVAENGTIVQAGDNGGSETIVIRYNPDGSLQKEFGTDGIAHINLVGPDKIYSLVLQPDGKVIVAGKYTSPTTSANFLIARLKADGTIDSSFGINGKRNLNFYGNQDIIYALALQPDGNILAAGDVDKNGFETPVMTLVRFKPDGFFDSSFAKNGIAFADFGKLLSGGNSIVLQKDGKITVGGFAKTVKRYDEGGQQFFGLAQFNSDGSPNNTFGEKGVTTTDFGYIPQINSISLQADNKIVAAGQVIIPANADSLPYFNLAIARYNNNGTPVAQKIKKLLRWAYNNNNSVALNWPAITGTGGGNYTVQRSSNYGTAGAAAIWQNLSGAVTGRQVNNVATYSYIDNSPLPGTNYYRVQQVSATGNAETSNVVAVTLNATVLVSPNPVQNVLYIKGLDAITTYSLQVVNSNGNTVIKASVKQVTAYKINTQDLNKGIYYLKLTFNGNSTAFKFVKQ